MVKEAIIYLIRAITYFIGATTYLYRAYLPQETSQPCTFSSQATLAQKSHLSFTAGVLCEHCHVRGPRSRWNPLGTWRDHGSWMLQGFNDWKLMKPMSYLTTEFHIFCSCSIVILPKFNCIPVRTFNYGIKLKITINYDDQQLIIMISINNDGAGLAGRLISDPY